VKVELISPGLRESGSVGKFFPAPALGLALIGGMTPPDIDIIITDELVQPIDFDKNPDLIGITVNTNSVVRAYEIADEFRSRGVPVVLGGSHATVVQQEAIQHADAVVIGEAECVWIQVLEDKKKGKLKKFYRSDKFPSLKNSPLPRRELFQNNKYITMNLVQTSRGCPFACQFCSISTIYGKGVRSRPVDEVIAEIKTLHGNELVFVDDNIVGHPEYAKQLLTKLTSLKKKWVGQASVTVADNDEILELLYKSGCQALYLGFETTSIVSLREVGKHQNITTSFHETIKKLHDIGIIVVGSFIVGFDSDDKFCFERLLDFLLKSKIDVADIDILVPYPGTVLYKKIKEENRLIEDKWWLKYNGHDVVYKPKLMTREELHQGWIWTLMESYKLRPTLKRCVGGMSRRSCCRSILNWKVNMAYRKYKLGLI
jgi:radical SAM superfamily enzyme YgiQ (UPF0313 family)